MKIRFSPPYIDDSVIDEVVDTLKSGWITTGPKVKALEAEIKKYSSAKEVLCVNSWTSGAILILKWFGVNAGDEVIVPAYTYAATALAVLHVGAKPVIVDVCDDFNISAETIRVAITSKTKAIIAVDFAGFPCDYSSIMSLVKEKEILKEFQPNSLIQKKMGRILVINDAAHSLGALNNNVRVGSETVVTIFSLHAVKNITTAEGGAICLNFPKPFNNSLLYEELKLMSMNCQTRESYSNSQNKIFKWQYDIFDLGMKINMPDVNAAIGLAQMRIYSKLLPIRKRIFSIYNSAFANCSWAILPPSEMNGKESSYHIYALRINGITESQRNDIIEEILKKQVTVNVHYIPLPMFSFFKNQGFDISDYPQAYKNYACEISLPIYPQLTDEEINFVINTVKESYEKVIY